MPVSFGLSGQGRRGGPRHEVHVHSKQGHQGVLAFTRSDLDFEPEIHPFLNPTNGAAMNKAVSFGGTQEIIHNGGTSVEWTGSVIQGSWDFSTGGVITLAAANDQDAATFSEETPTTIDMTGFVVLTGAINLTTYDESFNDIQLRWDNGGASVGDPVSLNDFIDTGLIGTAQNFAVAISNFNFASNTVDGFTIAISRSGGAKPAMTFDDITLQQTGEPLEYKATTHLGTRFHITELRLEVVDNVTGIVTVAGATENHSMVNLSYNKILGVSVLSTGIVFRRVKAGKTLFSLTLKQLGDFLASGSDLVNVISDGTNTSITLLFRFPEPIILDGTAAADYLSFTINDDLSGLLQFTAVVRGALEV